MLIACSCFLAIIYHGTIAYVNVLLGVASLYMVLFVQSTAVRNRASYGAMWLLLLELAVFVLELLGVSDYISPFSWIMYVLFVALEIFVTPKSFEE